MRICFVGDSFVNGTGDPDYRGWTGRICAAARSEGHDITHYNLGIRRDTSADIKSRWQNEVIRRLPNLSEGGIVFSFGTNDTTIENNKTRIDRQGSIQNARTILEVAQQLVPTLMISPLPVNDPEQNSRTAQLSKQFAEVCHALNVPYLDAFTPMQASGVWIEEASQYDGAHPLAAGYSQLAQLVQSWSAWLELLEELSKPSYVSLQN